MSRGVGWNRTHNLLVKSGCFTSCATVSIRTYTRAHIYNVHVNNRVQLLFHFETIYWGLGRKRTFWYVRPTKTQIGLHIRAVWSESSLSTWRNFALLAIQTAPSEDSDQTARMRRLIWIFAGRTCLKLRLLTLIAVHIVRLLDIIHVPV